ncbi:hypothetical protein LSUCC0031_13815 [Rhodobacterales bacterium LSUCC0031]|nr:hypothetical protein [Rhodobacterales bacterium LSUCC0031]
MATIFGGSGDDTLTGTPSDETILAGAGNDSISAGDGADSLSGGLGEDTIIGGAGADTINAGHDNDVVDGGDGADVVNGGLGDDSLSGGTDAAADTITGGAGNDTIEGFGGNDLIDGGPGDGDSVPGGVSDDDLIFGGEGDDTITGDVGNDTIEGGAGNDSLTGGLGDDTFVYQSGDGADTITDFLNGTGPLDDGDQTNNNFVDLSDFFDEASLAAVNALIGDPSTDFKNALQMLKADAADGTIDGVINDVNYGAQIGDINLRLEDGGVAVTGDNLTFDNTNVVCFAAGTRIMTDQGEVPIEDLVEGDLVLTRDDGLQPVRWIGKRKVDATGNLAPIRIAAGTFGNDRDLRVSPQHRILVTGWQAELLFGEDELLIPAKALVNETTISRQPIDTVVYCHVMFDRHQIILSEGMWTESLHTGKEAMDSLGAQSRQEILQIFPELDLATMPESPLARPTLSVREGRILASTFRLHLP